MFVQYAFKASILRVFATFLLAGSMALTCAAQKGPAYVPEEGQDGKDVIWLPTEGTIVDTMLMMAKVTPNDLVIDLGSGDGRTVIAAAKLGARAIGIEFNPDLVGYATAQAKKAGVADKTEFIRGDIYVTDFSKATVLTMFLLDEINMNLRPKILTMKPGTRIVTNTFTMGDWEPDQITRVEAFCTEFCTANLWYVPGNIGGRWSSDDGVLAVEQTFQNFTGALEAGGKKGTVRTGKLKGEEFRFEVDRVVYQGRIEGDKLVGIRTTSEGNKRPWSATRAK
jgi:SAM-dependent methyltransferase